MISYLTGIFLEKQVIISYRCQQKNKINPRLFILTVFLFKDLV